MAIVETITLEQPGGKNVRNLRYFSYFAMFSHQKAMRLPYVSSSNLRPSGWWDVWLGVKTC